MRMGSGEKEGEGEGENEDLQHKSYTRTIGEKYVLSVISACVAEFVTYPLDLTKTRLQLQGERGIGGTVYRGMISTAVGVAREEGIRALWQGVSPGMGRHIIYSGARMTIYDLGRDIWKGSGRELELVHRAILGMVAGGLGQVIASPADLIKVRMQMEGRRRLEGLPVRVHGVKDALSQVLKEGGVRALWKGAVPNMQRAALVNLGDLTTYDQAKEVLVSKGWSSKSWVTHSLSSLAAGLSAAVMGTPADVVKARMMNQPVDDRGRGVYYRGSIDCLLQAIRSEGVLSLYKGFVPCWLRMAPWSLTFWLTFEKLRSLANLDSW
ncbi:mitochondrial uncoupling protein 4 isoform X2 [Eurytemora carolleeae]|uniref:mitochondrial uncoupling protein 4 isoform X1 n=1 Tax=Eurytemora carolleeae TaxID=1294199 RepID=UPI000C785AF0|nr:mitochondrial uncoupling protein 4 isoform X1 [Eurytemora carolleeae]XP_023322182.1 mitochondrial uncoupling protein 4 isoform X2 [Eurytemora carolleeae]|eukprot:XP_023322181.1 mitochondrial uncoupling protein 4-like isoform X1 [Eurytemora affinis]